MRPEIKFCGLTRPEDAAEAAAIGAAYVGVIFAGGPRSIPIDQALRVLDAAGPGPLRVGVFGRMDHAEIARTAEALGLHVLQLHGDLGVGEIGPLRTLTGRTIWGVLRVAGSSLPPGAEQFFAATDATVVDARHPDLLGGTGLALPWAELAPALSVLRAGRRLVLAGGLKPENVREAILQVAPDVVDVSSGVERAPGEKDHHQMRRFAEAVWTTP